MPAYKPEIIEVLASLGWEETQPLTQSFASTQEFWLFDSAGHRTVGVVPITSTRANGYDGSRGGTRFALHAEGAGPAMKPRVIDSTKPQWKNKLHAWMAEYTFRREHCRQQIEEERHRAALHLERCTNQTERLIAPFNLTLVQFETFFRAYYHVDSWDGTKLVGWTVNANFKPDVLHLDTAKALNRCLHRFDSMDFNDAIVLAAKLTRAFIDCGFYVDP